MEPMMLGERRGVLLSVSSQWPDLPHRCYSRSFDEARLLLRQRNGVENDLNDRSERRIDDGAHSNGALC